MWALVYSTQVPDYTFVQSIVVKEDRETIETPVATIVRRSAKSWSDRSLVRTLDALREAVRDQANIEGNGPLAALMDNDMAHQTLNWKKEVPQPDGSMSWRIISNDADFFEVGQTDSTVKYSTQTREVQADPAVTDAWFRWISNAPFWIIFTARAIENTLIHMNNIFTKIREN